MPSIMKLAWPLRFVFFFLAILVGVTLARLLIHETLRNIWQEALGATVVAMILLSLYYRYKNA